MIQLHQNLWIKMIQGKWFIRGSIFCQQIYIRFKASILRSHCCNYSNICDVVKERRSAKGTKDKNRKNEKLTLKNNAAFRSWI